MRFLILLIAVVCATVAVRAQSALGPRLGDEISRAERDYFGLFPDLGTAFVAAQVTAQDGGARIIVQRTDAADTTLVLDAAAASALRRFMETFEQSPSAFLNPNWQAAAGPTAVRRLDASVAVPHVDPGATTVLTVGARRIEGVVLAASDTLLLLHPASPYRWNMPLVARIRPSDISLVEIGRSRPERLGRVVQIAGGLAGLGAAAVNAFAFSGGVSTLPSAVTGVALGIAGAGLVAPAPPPAGSYDARLSALRARAAFRLSVPVDFRPVEVPAADLTRGAAAGSTVAQRLARWRRDHGWVNVSLVGGATGTFEGAGAYTESSTVFNPNQQTRATIFRSVDPEIGVDVALRPVPFVRLGGTWLRSRTETVEPGQTALATVAPSTLRGYAEVVLPSPRVRGFGIDLSAGIGRESSRTTVEGAPFNGDAPFAFEVSDRRSTTFTQATLDLVLPQRSAVFLRVASRAIPDLDVPGGETFSTRFPDVRVYRLDPFTASFGTYREITWGTRFRF